MEEDEDLDIQEHFVEEEDDMDESGTNIVCLVIIFLTRC